MRIIFPLLTVLLLYSCSSGGGEGQTGVQVGDLAPGIVHTDVNGNAFDLSDLRGSYVVIDFLGSWCGPCVREAPELVKLHETYAPKGLKVVSIAIEKDDKRTAEAARKLGYTWPHQLVSVSRYVRFDDIASAYEVTDIPSAFLIDPEGRVVSSATSISEIDALVHDILKTS